MCPGHSRGGWPGWQDKSLHSWPKAVLPAAHPSLPESWWHSGHRRGGLPGSLCQEEATGLELMSSREPVQVPAGLS